jgi:hypothetical protein
MTGTKKGPHFGGGTENTKLVRTIANDVRRARLDYERVPPGLRSREEATGPSEAPRSRQLPRILQEASLSSKN